MPYMIDGNNLLGAARDRSLGLPRTEADLVRVLADFAGQRRATVTVVFDGPRSERRGPGTAGRVGGLVVKYSGSGRTADEMILELAGRSRQPRDIVLVTSDRSLRARARGLGCRAMGCRDFAARLAASHGGAPSGAGAGEKPLAGDIEEWEDYFSSREPREPAE